MGLAELHDGVSRVRSFYHFRFADLEASDFILSTQPRLTNRYLACIAPHNDAPRSAPQRWYVLRRAMMRCVAFAIPANPRPAGKPVLPEDGRGASRPV